MPGGYTYLIHSNAKRVKPHLTAVATDLSEDAHCYRTHNGHLGLREWCRDASTHHRFAGPRPPAQAVLLLLVNCTLSHGLNAKRFWLALESSADRRKTEQLE